jgi:hypothetical protein
VQEADIVVGTGNTSQETTFSWGANNIANSIPVHAGHCHNSIQNKNNDGNESFPG